MLNIFIMSLGCECVTKFSTPAKQTTVRRVLASKKLSGPDKDRLFWLECDDKVKVVEVV